jgi:hypothetical protein
MTVENEELNEDSLFDEAVTDAPADPPEPQPDPEPQPEPDAQLTPAPGDKPVVDDNAAMIPSFRLKQEADARRQVEADLANERADKAALRQRLEALEKPAAKVEVSKATKPDPLLDPEGYAKAVREEVREEMLAERRETSLANAHKTYKTEFEEAYAAAQKNLDPALKARMQASRDPGETLIEWHREAKAKAEVGTDLAAYKQKLREEALKDPEFRKAAMEAWRDQASTQTKDGRPRIDLGPSLNGASRSNASLRSAMDADVDDDSLFEQTTA